ncbi:hypothetical protein HDU93_004354 [Gonapodya sp. JEL0774]|nr:hypothetical protein HDU93_004354 [Gonapodya sp. JEL0774]
MATTDSDQAVLVTLVRTVLRAYYPPPYVLVMDILTRVGEARDDELVARTKIPAKELARICQRLKDDRLLAAYFIDYMQFVNAVKLRLALVQRRIKRDIKESESRQSFLCPVCRTTYDLTDALRLFDAARNQMLCTYDGTVVDVVKESGGRGEETLRKFTKENGMVMEMLKRADEMKVVGHHRAAKLTKEQRQAIKAELSLSSSSSLSTSGLSSTNAGDLARQMAQGRVEVVIHEGNGTGGSGNTGTGKVTSHDLPIWHQYSTVTGERVVPSKNAGHGRGQVGQGKGKGGMSQGGKAGEGEEGEEEEEARRIAAYLANYQGAASDPDPDPDSDPSDDEEEFSSVDGASVGGSGSAVGSPAAVGSPVYTGPDVGGGEDSEVGRGVKRGREEEEEKREAQKVEGKVEGGGVEEDEEFEDV